MWYILISKISSAYKIWLYKYRPKTLPFPPILFNTKVIDVHIVLLPYVINFKIQITEVNAGSITRPIFSLFLAHTNYDRSLVGVMTSLYWIIEPHNV